MAKSNFTNLPSLARVGVLMLTTLVLVISLWVVWVNLAGNKSVPYDRSSDDITGTVGSLNTEARTQTNMQNNFVLAHNHTNAHLFLYLSLGILFLLTSVRANLKRLVVITFGVLILLNAFGQSGAGYHTFFDYTLFASGIMLIGLIAYMCLRIYMDLGRRPKARAL